MNCLMPRDFRLVTHANVLFFITHLFSSLLLMEKMLKVVQGFMGMNEIK